MPSTETDLIATRIAERIHELRGHNVMLDHDLADLYRVDVRVLNQAVGRNGDRFPPDALGAKYDDHFKIVFEAIRQLMEPPLESAKVIGFRTDGEE